MTCPPDLDCVEDAPLAPRTTLGVGGPARYLVRCSGVADLQAATAFARQADLPLAVLGGGSNLLVADDGFDGVVLESTDDGVAFEVADGDHGQVGDLVAVSAGAAVDWDRFVAHCADEKLAGVECLSGIPGRVGAAPVQNIGAYGQEIAETVHQVDVFDLVEGTTRSLSNAECEFDYRYSRFKGPWRGRFLVLRVHFRMRRRDVGTVRYPDLRKHLDLSETDETADGPGLSTVRAAVLDVRRGKSMVQDDPEDPNRRSAGSFFVNPVVDAETAQHVLHVAREVTGGEPPHWPVRRRVKLPAAWLIEAAGFAKGHRRGNVGLSTRHSLALVNLGGATAAELVDLAAEIRRAVHQRFGVVLEPEPSFLGWDAPPHEVLGILD